jgi:hypothetical protein
MLIDVNMDKYMVGVTYYHFRKDDYEVFISLYNDPNPSSLI